MLFSIAKSGRFWNAVFLTTGTMVGVGLLALPICLGQAGFLPGLCTLLAVAMLAWLGGYMLAERVIDRRMEKGDLLTLYRTDLGITAWWITAIGYIMLFYALLIVYLTGAGSIMAGLIGAGLPAKVWVVGFFVVATFTFFVGKDAVLRWNRLVGLLMLAAFGCLLASCMGRIDSVNLEHANWRMMLPAAPVVCCAFAYQNVIPIVCRQQNWDRRSVHSALGLGLVLALVMNTLWFVVVVGTLPLEARNGASVMEAFKNGLPATVPLSSFLGSRLVTLTGLVFSLLAVFTSYIGVGASLTSFLADGLPELASFRGGTALRALVFLPPLVLATLYPDIFLEMVDVTGGMGMILLFGMLPTLAFMRHRAGGRRLHLLFLGTLFLLFAVIFLFEFSKQVGKLV